MRRVNGLLTVGLVAALLAVTGCGDRAKYQYDGKVLYSDGELFGVLSDPTLKDNGRWQIYSDQGLPKGEMSQDHIVYDVNGKPVGSTECTSQNPKTFDKNGFLVGKCTLGISSADALKGMSAYEIAVANGFKGTEKQWLDSLKGKDGKNGKDGKDGANGKDGKDGKDGANGKDGKDGKDGKLPKLPEYICEPGDTDPLCTAQQNEYKVSKFIFSREADLTKPYEDGGLVTKGVVIGDVETIRWVARRANGSVLPLYSIENKWQNGSFASNSAPFPSHDDTSETKYRVISDGGNLVFESDQGDKATLNISEDGVVTITNSGLTITHDKVNKDICFVGEKTACISYLVFWEPK